VTTSESSLLYVFVFILSLLINWSLSDRFLFYLLNFRGLGIKTPGVIGLSGERAIKASQINIRNSFIVSLAKSLLTQRFTIISYNYLRSSDQEIDYGYRNIRSVR
jgi:hypothetical protein